VSRKEESGGSVQLPAVFPRGFRANTFGTAWSPEQLRRVEQTINEAKSRTLGGYPDRGTVFDYPSGKGGERGFSSLIEEERSSNKVWESTKNR